MPDQFVVLDLRVIHGAAGRLRQRIARPELPCELAVLDFDHRDRLGVRDTVEEHALEVVADLLHFEKVDQVIVGSGAGEVPSSDERVLLSRSDDISCGQHSDDDGELRAHESIPSCRAGASAQRAQIIAARAGGQLRGEKVFRGRRCPGIQQRGWRAAEGIQVRVGGGRSEVSRRGPSLAQVELGFADAKRKEKLRLSRDGRRTMQLISDVLAVHLRSPESIASCGGHPSPVGSVSSLNLRVSPERRMACHP